MRIFVAGATGVIGTRLVPLLIAAGHEVAGMTRSEAKAQRLRELGAEPVVCDVFDADAVRAAVVGFAPDAVVNELTDLPDDQAKLAEGRASNARIRREGTRNLLAAARAAGATRIVSQSVAWEMAGDGAAAVEYLERETLGAGGVVVRYGQLYGPGTYFENEPPPHPRVHVDEAARRTVAALDAD
ncbi:MAG TPA: NAD-dependent epimerase/dehydratase family protein, partial [Solirubrobacteraceae bacterium]